MRFQGGKLVLSAPVTRARVIRRGGQVSESAAAEAARRLCERWRSSSAQWRVAGGCVCDHFPEARSICDSAYRRKDRVPHGLHHRGLSSTLPELSCGAKGEICI